MTPEIKARYLEVAEAPFAAVQALAVGLGVAVDRVREQYGEDNVPELLEGFLDTIAAASTQFLDTQNLG